MTVAQSKLAWIQSLRGIAVFLVVLTHARYGFLDTPTWPLAETLLRPGAFGVDLFFVISGFIMVHTTRRSDGSARYALDFLIKRFARIWPLYAVATLAWLLATYGNLDFLANAQVLRNLALSLSFQPVDPNAPMYFGATLPLGWTLNFEMYFYLVFAAGLLLGRWRWLFLLAWVLLSVIALPAFTRSLTFDVMSNFGFSIAYLNLVTNPIVLEFFAGALIGWCFNQDWFRVQSAAVCRHILFLSIAIVAWYVYSGLGSFHGPRQWGWAAALLVLGMALASKTVAIAPPPVLIWLGTISYSLYLTHTTVQLVAGLQVERLGGDTHGWMHIVLTTALAISVAALVHHYLEEKMSLRVRAALLSAADRWFGRGGRSASADAGAVLRQP